MEPRIEPGRLQWVRGITGDGNTLIFGAARPRTHPTGRCRASRTTRSLCRLPPPALPAGAGFQISQGGVVENHDQNCILARKMSCLFFSQTTFVMLLCYSERMYGIGNDL